MVHRASGVMIRNEAFGDSYKAACGVWQVRPWVMMAIPKELGRALCHKCFATESHVVTDQGIVRLLGGTGAGIPGLIPPRDGWIGTNGHHG